MSPNISPLKISLILLMSILTIHCTEENQVTQESTVQNIDVYITLSPEGLSISCCIVGEIDGGGGTDTLKQSPGLNIWEGSIRDIEPWEGRLMNFSVHGIGFNNFEGFTVLNIGPYFSPGVHAVYFDARWEIGNWVVDIRNV